MRCPALTELPPPPPGKTGWPWTAESEQLPDTMPVLNGVEGPDGSPWPRVSIVTPSYNQAQFIEETIRSVLLQGYPNLEYIIIDGGSTDGSVEIIRKYEPWLAYWVSEKDKGQSHAINKGLNLSTGCFFAWMNSDDFYAPDVFGKVGRYAAEHPDARIIYGNLCLISAAGTCRGRLLGQYTRERFLTFFDENYLGISQPATFFSKALLDRIGPVNETLHYIMDYELLLRASFVCDFDYIDANITYFRIHESSKTGSGKYHFTREHMKIMRWYAPQLKQFLQLEFSDYVGRAKFYYASLLTSEVLSGRISDQRASLKLLLEAAWNYPNLLKASWYWRHVIKSFIGPNASLKIRGLLGKIRK